MNIAPTEKSCDSTTPHRSHIWYPPRASEQEYQPQHVCQGIEYTAENIPGWGSEPEKDSAQELLDSRRSVYGDRVQNMERTAALWSALLGHKIEDWQVPLMMSAYKMLRTFETPDYSDNSDDIGGWTKMFVEVMDANHGGIIQARTVEEYHRIKAGPPLKKQGMAEPTEPGIKQHEVRLGGESYFFSSKKDVDRLFDLLADLAVMGHIDPKQVKDVKTYVDIATDVHRQQHQQRFADSGVAGVQDDEDGEVGMLQCDGRRSVLEDDNSSYVAQCLLPLGHKGARHWDPTHQISWPV